MKNTEVQKALDQMVNSIDTMELGRVLEAQISRPEGVTCSICGKVTRNLRGNSLHHRTHLSNR